MWGPQLGFGQQDGNEQKLQDDFEQIQERIVLSGHSKRRLKIVSRLINA